MYQNNILKSVKSGAPICMNYDRRKHTSEEKEVIL